MSTDRSLPPPTPVSPRQRASCLPSEQGAHKLGDEGHRPLFLNSHMMGVCRLQGLVCWGFSFTLWFQFPVLGRIKAQEDEALRKRVPTGPFGMSWMFLPFSPIRAPPCRKQTGPPPMPSAASSSRVDRAEDPA